MSAALWSAAPVLCTERFDLWRPQPSDIDGLCALIDDAETQRFLGPAARDRKAQHERLLRNAGSWALFGYGTFMVRPRGLDDMIAGCGLFHSYRGFGKGMDDLPEAGWIVRRDWWAKGVASEVMSAVLDWFGQTHGSRRVGCMIEDGNTASVRLAAKLGFSRYDQHREDGGVLINLYERIT